MDASDWDERYAGSELVWSAGPNQFVAEHLVDLPCGSAVDLAAGEARNAVWLAEKGWSVQAVDFSGKGLDKARSIAEQRGVADRVELVEADARTWRPDEPVDLVVVAYLQLAAGPRGEALRNALTMLRPGGTLFVVAHDSSNLADGHGGPQDPAVLYTAEDVLGDLADAEARTKVETAGRVGREVRTDDGHATAYDCLVLLTRAA
ncbi:class I SAM-dependent methyltransferase [Nocardioidaceae bacterium]|nr:class I SAM-dependent methyltransferase [Nocardioidaceae bacterium]